MSHNFQFKKFSIVQKQSAMKVNTDGVLLGAWANINGATQILDVGTGTGVIALMMAQRNFKCMVTGVEIDSNSYVEASENCSSSPYSKRVRVVHHSLQDYAVTSSTKYDHIISNPPYFNTGPVSLDKARSKVRHTLSLSHTDLIRCSVSLMSNRSQLSLIVPLSEFEYIQELANKAGLYLHRKCEVWINERQIGRIMCTWTNCLCELKDTEDILIRKADGEYSEEYRELTRDFYLKF